ncbi:MAG: response regulator [Acidobacteriota bacterium]
MVEDDPMYAHVIQRYLEDPSARGLVVKRADRLAASLEVLGNERVDLVLLDLSLPDSDGYETFERLRQAAPGVPVIVLTGFEDEAMAERSVRNGAQDFLVKSDMSPSLLVRSIRYALERWKAASRLEESERRYRAVVEDQTELVCRYLPNGELTFVNDAFCRFFGAASDDLLGRKFFSVAVDKDMMEFATRLAALDRRQPLRTREQRFEDAERGARWLQWTDRALFDTAGRLSEYQSVGRDTTEQKLLEGQLRQSQKMEVVGQLTGGIAHDFNNLLMVITGYSELLLQRLASENREPNRFLVAIDQAAQRAASLTRRLLAFSRRQIVQPANLDLTEVVKEVDEMLRYLLGERIELRLNLETGFCWVKVDPGQIEQIVINLAVNARDAMPEGGQLALETSVAELDGGMLSGREVEPGRYAVLSVSDTGCGMDEVTQRKIFEPFFTTKKAGLGTGLGLSTVKAILDQIGGYITVESAVGRGTTFRTYLPIIDQASESLTLQTSREQISELTGTETVLLVEDDEPVRAVIATMLEGHGYRVLSARNGRSAIRLMRQSSEAIHLLLTDVVMPGLTGPELARQARDVRPLIQVLYMSGYSESADGLKLDDASMALIQKPFSADRLLYQLRQVLDRAESQ